MAKYVSNDELAAEVDKWRESAESPERRVCSPRLIALLYAIAEGVASRSAFAVNRHWRNDFVQIAVVKEWRSLGNLDGKRRNKWFAYLCLAAHCGIISHCRKIRRWQKAQAAARGIATNVLKDIARRGGVAHDGDLGELLGDIGL